MVCKCGDCASPFFFIDFPFAQFVPLSIWTLHSLPCSFIHSRHRSSLMGANYTPANRLHMSLSSSSSSSSSAFRRKVIDAGTFNRCRVRERAMIVVIRATRVEVEVLLSAKGLKLWHMSALVRRLWWWYGYYYDICDLIGLMTCYGGCHEAMIQILELRWGVSARDGHDDVFPLSFFTSWHLEWLL